MARFGRSFPIPQGVSKFVPAVSGTTVAVAGTARAFGRVIGVATTLVVLAGTARADVRTIGAATTSTVISGTARSVVRAVGNVTTGAVVSGTARAIVRTIGSASTQVAAGGTSRVVVRAIGTAAVTTEPQVVGVARAITRSIGVASTSVVVAGTSREVTRTIGLVATPSTVNVAGVSRSVVRTIGNVSALSTLALAGTSRTVVRTIGTTSTTAPIVGISRIVVRTIGLFTAPVTTAASDPYDNELVDTQLEIEDLKAIIPAGLSTTRRPGALTFDYLTAFTLGPATIGSALGGATEHAWYVRTEDNTVYYARSNVAYNGWEAEQILFTFAGAEITELDTAFEQNGRIVVSAERPTGIAGAAQIWLYWYKPSLAAFTFEVIDSGRTPRIVLDNPNDTTISDIQLGYFKDGVGLVTRRQAELYAIQQPTVHTESVNWFLEEFARNRGNRLVAIMSHRSGDRYSLGRIESTLYPFYPTSEVTTFMRVLPTSILLNAALVVPLYDVDSIASTARIRSTSTLLDIVLLSLTYDVDGIASTLTVRSTSTLLVIVIVDELNDPDSIATTVTIRNTSSLLVVGITDELNDLNGIAATMTVRSTSTLAP